MPVRCRQAPGYPRCGRADRALSGRPMRFPRECSFPAPAADGLAQMAAMTHHSATDSAFPVPAEVDVRDRNVAFGGGPCRRLPDRRPTAGSDIFREFGSIICPSMRAMAGIRTDASVPSRRSSSGSIASTATPGSTRPRCSRRGAAKPVPATTTRPMKAVPRRVMTKANGSRGPECRSRSAGERLQAGLDHPS